MTLKHYIALASLLTAQTLFAQSDRGTLTGTVSDSADAVIPNVTVSLFNAETGGRHQTATTGTGNYTITGVPAGVYELTVEVPGFKRHSQKGITIQVATTVRADVMLQVGSTTETVNVEATAPLLRTESAEQSVNITTERMNSLPLNFGVINSGSIRNPMGFAQLAPGVYYQPGSNNNIKVNGSPNTSFKVVLEGQDATNGITPQVANVSQPSVEAIQEFTLQVSNFAPEFGQVSGGLFNFTARSGTNAFHGSAYEYFVNEALNAGQPFTDNREGELIRSRTRKNDFGFSVGGPILIPRLYDGRNRTFFFFNDEFYRNTNVQAGNMVTVPTEAMRNGDFSSVLRTGTVLNTDPLGRPIYENAIYDPLTSRMVNGQLVRDAFPNNIIPRDRMDPVALKIQALIPLPTAPGAVNNFQQVYKIVRNQAIPSVKIDHNFGSVSKVAFYYSHQGTKSTADGQDGLPVPLTAYRDKYIYAHTLRLNYDHSLSPTVLLHLGAGEQRFHNPDASPASVLDYDAVGELGLRGGATAGFPRITGLNSSFGGMSLGMGPTNANKYYTDKPTAVATVSIVRSNHTYKLGADWQRNTYTDRNTRGASGSYSFGATETGLPSTNGQNLQGRPVGFPYASFLLGLAGGASVNSPQDPQLVKSVWAMFVQDTWKVTRRLTLDYGLRWDYQTGTRELHYRTSSFGPTIPNPAAGGLPGAIAYEGYGPGRCDCQLARTYPYAIGPRIGAAYQIDDKTVLRAGWGITYGATAPFNYITNQPILGVGFNQLNFTAPAFGEPAVVLQNGLSYNPADLTRATYDAGIRPTPGQIDSPPYMIDPNGGRPPRIMQWSIGLQRQITKDLVVEAAYVGNRGAWFQANNLVDLNALTPERIRSAGLDINNAADRTLLASRIDSSLAQGRNFRAPYAGFPVGQSVAQTLRPFPQFGNIPVQWAPLGKNWYDSLQVKATKRYSYGLDFSAAFTWQKELTLGSDGGSVNDVFNRENQKRLSPSSQPYVFVTAFTYEIPGFGNRLVKAVAGGWSLGGVLRYASGLPIMVPSANNNLNSLLFRGTYANRVPGEPLFLKDLNCHCIDPNKEFVLNPKAWADPPAGQWGTSAAFYNDYRGQRRYDEQLNIGRAFRIREKMSFQVRAEFFNAFNRTYMNNPDSGNAQTPQVLNAQGVVVSGFGRINTGSVNQPPRNGQLVARFQW